MIPIQNIYYMLSYAFGVLRQRGYRKVGAEKFENAGELYSEILILGVTSLVKKGLVRDYVPKTEALGTVRGKIDVPTSVKTRSIVKKQLVCDYDEFSPDTNMNRAIKATMNLLIKSDISPGRRERLRRLLLYFSPVSDVPISRINWRIQYNKNNQSCRMIISVCQLIVRGLLQTREDGSRKLADFLDEKNLYALYEKFILEYYRKEHPEIRASSPQIPWDLDDDVTDFLPAMQSDVMLEKDGKKLIIDAKFYNKTLQRQYGKKTVHSANLYQIYTYVKNCDKDRTGNVSGMLLYAATDEEVLPDSEYSIGGNRIRVRTLDLGTDFSSIRRQLDGIARDFLKAPVCPAELNGAARSQGHMI